MHFFFKTTYLQDIRLVKHGGQAFWYGLLVLALLARRGSCPSMAGAGTFSSLFGVGPLELLSLHRTVLLGHAAFSASARTPRPCWWNRRPFRAPSPAPGCRPRRRRRRLPALRVRASPGDRDAGGRISASRCARAGKSPEGQCRQQVSRRRSWAGRDSDLSFYLRRVIACWRARDPHRCARRRPGFRRHPRLGVSAQASHGSPTKRRVVAISAALAGSGAPLPHKRQFISPDSSRSAVARPVRMSGGAGSARCRRFPRSASSPSRSIRERTPAAVSGQPRAPGRLRPGATASSFEPDGIYGRC